MRVAVYTRVSSRGQGEDDRLGIPTQVTTVDRFCAEYGHEVVSRYSDVGFSGATADRPDLARMLSDAADKRFEGVVVYRGDRLARDVMLDGYLRFTLKRHGVRVWSASEKDASGEDPTAQLTQAVLAAVAAFERHLIKARLSAARRLKKARGGYADGRPRYGYRAEGAALVQDEQEQMALRLMRRLRRKGEPYRAIGTALELAGHSPRHGRDWNTSTIHQVLSRKTSRPRTVKPGIGMIGIE